MSQEFKKDQIYRYSQEDWVIIGVVISATTNRVTFEDLSVEGDIPLMSRYQQTLPLSFKNPKYELLGIKDDFPEYFL